MMGAEKSVLLRDLVLPAPLRPTAAADRLDERLVDVAEEPSTNGRRKHMAQHHDVLRIVSLLTRPVQVLPVRRPRPNLTIVLLGVAGKHVARQPVAHFAQVRLVRSTRLSQRQHLDALILLLVLEEPCAGACVGGLLAVLCATSCCRRGLAGALDAVELAVSTRRQNVSAPRFEASTRGSNAGSRVARRNRYEGVYRRVQHDPQDRRTVRHAMGAWRGVGAEPHP